jgi:hypothetical protein
MLWLAGSILRLVRLRERNAVASVSGFMFRGYAGNPVNGPNDGSGQPFDRFGSDDAAVEERSILQG